MFSLKDTCGIKLLIPQPHLSFKNTCRWYLLSFSSSLRAWMSHSHLRTAEETCVQ